MATTIKSAVITVCLFVAAVGLYRYTQTLQERKNSDETVSKIYTALNFYGKNYDKTGFLHHTIKADIASYNDGNGIAHFTNPVIVTYRIGKDKHIEKWVMSGEQGQVRDGDFALMERNVVLKPLFKGAAITKAQSPKVNYNFKSNLVTSPDLTILHGIGWINSGTDFTIDLNKDISTYKGNVNAIYYPAQHSAH
ncbi:MAG TPA: LPS export ABC transporter periplasmic protein LptC [Succinivibrionaceae bacterium]|nr:LPS export ABC transporter periplasmic protein LptC [Succinivibrionaceae bacterium]